MTCNWLNKILRWFGINFSDVPSEKERCWRTQQWIDLEDWDFVKGCRVKKKKKTDTK